MAHRISQGSVRLVIPPPLGSFDTTRRRTSLRASRTITFSVTLHIHVSDTLTITDAKRHGLEILSNPSQLRTTLLVVAASLANLDNTGLSALCTFGGPDAMEMGSVRRSNKNWPK